MEKYIKLVKLIIDTYEKAGFEGMNNEESAIYQAALTAEAWKSPDFEKALEERVEPLWYPHNETFEEGARWAISNALPPSQGQEVVDFAQWLIDKNYEIDYKGGYVDYSVTPAPRYTPTEIYQLYLNSKQP